MPSSPLPPEEPSVPLGTITAITGSRRRPGRFDVAIDGSVAVTLSLDAIEQSKIAVGTIVNEALAERLAQAGAELATYDRALNMLALRARSSAELHRLLVKKGEPVARADAAIARLLAHGFLDDGAFARQFARSRAVGAGRSRRRIAQELARRGVAREIADEAIDATFVDERVDEAENLDRVARRKLSTLHRFDAPTRRRRLYAFLARRGYDGDDIARTVRTLLAESSRGDEDPSASEMASGR